MFCVLNRIAQKTVLPLNSFIEATTTTTDGSHQTTTATIEMPSETQAARLKVASVFQCRSSSLHLHPHPTRMILGPALGKMMVERLHHQPKPLQIAALAVLLGLLVLQPCNHPQGELSEGQTPGMTSHL